MLLDRNTHFFSVKCCPISSQLAESAAAVASAQPGHGYFTNPANSRTGRALKWHHDWLWALCLLKYLLNKPGLINKQPFCSFSLLFPVSWTLINHCCVMVAAGDARDEPLMTEDHICRGWSSASAGQWITLSHSCLLKADQNPWIYSLQMVLKAPKLRLCWVNVTDFWWDATMALGWGGSWARRKGCGFSTDKGSAFNLYLQHREILKGRSGSTENLLLKT